MCVLWHSHLRERHIRLCEIGELRVEEEEEKPAKGAVFLIQRSAEECAWIELNDV